MYKLCKTEQSAARQRQIEDGLLSLMLTRRYDEITVSDLCEFLSIPRKSFYRYFTGKEGALHALIDHTLLGFELFAAPGNHSKKRTLLNEMENFFQFWLTNRPLLDALAQSGLTGMLIERAVGHSVSESVLPKRFLPGESSEMQRQVTMFCACGMMSMVVAWHHDGYPQPPKEMAQITRRLLVQPLFPDVENFL